MSKIKCYPPGFPIPMKIITLLNEKDGARFVVDVAINSSDPRSIILIAQGVWSVSIAIEDDGSLGAYVVDHVQGLQIFHRKQFPFSIENDVEEQSDE